MAPRTDEELETLADKLDRWLDEVDPSTLEWDDPADLREVTHATEALEAARQRQLEAVAAARANGRSWNWIALCLNVSRQAARQRFAAKVESVDV